MGKLICQPGEEFIHKHRAFTRKGKYQGSFLFFDGPADMNSTFSGRHHFIFIHG